MTMVIALLLVLAALAGLFFDAYAEETDIARAVALVVFLRHVQALPNTDMPAAGHQGQSVEPGHSLV
jgi:hypothetical protein